MNGWSDDTERRRLSEPPLPPELSPRRAAAAAGGVPPQQTRRAQPGGQPGGPGGPYGPPTPGGQGAQAAGPRRPRWSTRKKIGYTALGLVVVLLVVSVSTYFWADSKVRREVDLGKITDAPPKGKGTNYLIVGSDSREGLTPQEEKELHTGADSGQRTDSMMILHTGSNGTTMMSLPRDSFVTIPSFVGQQSGKKYAASTHKLNKAYADGGPELLTRTIEYNTGIHIDHYAEIGFSGFVNLVDALGGVHMCLDKPLHDKASGADFNAGCQKLNGKQSLAFVRQRHQEADQDLGRMRNQQKFLSTLAHQAASPSTVLNPFKLYPVIGSGLDTLIVDKNMSLLDLTHMFWAMKGVTGGNGKQLTVPIANANYETATDGDAVKWDMPKANELFSELKQDQKVTVS
ncbi:LCP family protein [Actinacidiphila guanduensis]|jgi:LCP family protein required for cell wall assembly|uniref:Transcriptional attenuator, LytR family n=1 Tax=Actinacidiphila guanduensis TaxID=310781 RepID=A0A1H0ET85_9ACTN|nr:LCP family protein [Actinacidiphila guanduensis]SDN85604.1 transcriptional attenuator, LytR family [Actinacidiphila guanduensis]